MMLKKGLARDFDKTLLLITILISLVGLIALYSATQAKGPEVSRGYILRQAGWFAIGMLILFIIVNISYQRFIDASYPLYAVNLFLLLLILVVGGRRLGAQRWFSIGAFAFQPSEFIKITLILALSNYVGTRRERMSEFRSLAVPILLMTVPFLLVILQPDLGTALILVPIFFTILFVGGADWRHLLAMIAAGLLSLPFLWHLLHGYQKQRLLVFLNPNIDPLGAGYTIIQSKIAIGSGGLFGKGWLSGTQNQMNFLPERHTDFIFSVVGEEWGFLGSLALVLACLFIVKRAFRTASLTSDLYGTLVASGIAVMLSLQIIINISMTIGLMPVVGIPLPLVSYGGSSLVATCIAIGLLLNVGMRRSTF